ncbi:MAG: GH36-type glycosyl hydrolase domain-containing protein [Oceanipulchritudo sp.]
MKKETETRYGHFREDGKAYILKEGQLERPWMNVLSNGRWCYVASQLGGGYSFLDNPTVGRITRWHIDGTPRDTTGKFLYLKDLESGAWWNANGYPPTRGLDKWECEIGLGYNEIRSEAHGIGARMRYFCPMPDPSITGGVGDPCLIWQVELTNNSERERLISTVGYVELALGNWNEDTSWREFYILFNRQKFLGHALLTRSTMWVKYEGGWQAMNEAGNNIPFEHSVFLASSEPICSYEGDRHKFIGSYRDLKDPVAMEGNKLNNNVNVGRDACHALQSCHKLKPGESVRLVYLLGAVPYESRDTTSLTGKYLNWEKAEKAFAENQAYWEAVTESPHVETPDPGLNTLVNYWYKYQGANLSWWNRNPGYCYFGIYNFGVRDACQDAVSRLSQDPAWVREHIVKRIMIWQFEEGDYAHGGNFVSMMGTRTRHSDDPVNPLFILAHYVRETGDFSILDEVTEFAHTRGEKTATIYEHIMIGLEYFFSQLSERGLPLMLKADWNDALDQMGHKGKGDSVMLACWAIHCIERFYCCMEYRKDPRIADYREKVEQLRRTVNEIGWDGEWYQRGMHDDGWILGTKMNEYGKIWSNPNSFAIISDTASPERREQIYKSFEEHLDDPIGGYTFHPPFMEPDPKVGVISRFAPGTKENGAIFGHSSRWRIWAECYGGRGDKAYELLDKMSPLTRHLAGPELYRIEPYVACQFIYARESDRYGEGSHSWATGTAAWSLIVVWEWIFGVRPELNGLRVDPCLPGDWTGARMQRDYRGARYDITFRKRKGICKGKVTVELNGLVLKENLIPPQNDGKEHQVLVTIE